MHNRRVQSASSPTRRKSSEKLQKINGLTYKLSKKLSSIQQKPEQKYFSGLEITNIFLIEQPRKKLARKNSNFDADYKPINYLDYLKSNFDKILLDRSFEKTETTHNVFKAGKLRTGLAYRKVHLKSRQNPPNFHLN